MRGAVNDTDLVMSEILGDPFLECYFSGEDFHQRCQQVGVFVVANEWESCHCVRVEADTLRHNGGFDFRLGARFRCGVVTFVISIGFLGNRGKFSIRRGRF